MMILLVGAAAILSIPSTQLVLLEDYPQWALQSEASAAAVVRVVVDRTGKLECTATQSFGDAGLAKAICPIIKRKRLPSATARDGTKIHFTDEQLITFFLPGTKASKQIEALTEAPDAELSVNRLPDGKAVDVRVILHFDRNGEVVDCGPVSPKEQPDLVSAACGQRAIFNGAIEHDSAGQTVSYLTTRRVRFVIAALSAPQRD